jgi:hypothetical protein
VNHRITWLLQVQAFAFVFFGAILQYGPVLRKDRPGLFPYLWWILGVFFGYVAYWSACISVAVKRAHEQLRLLHERYEKIPKRHDWLPPLQRTPELGRGRLLDIDGIAMGTAFLWIALLIIFCWSLIATFHAVFGVVLGALLVVFVVAPYIWFFPRLKGGKKAKAQD